MSDNTGKAEVPQPRNNFETQLGKTAELVAHTFAAFVGFFGIGLIAMLAGLVVTWVTPIASKEVVKVLQYVEVGLLYSDFILFGIVFVLGLLEFASCAAADTVAAMRKHWKKG